MEKLKELSERLKKVDINGLKREGKDFSFVEIFPKIEELYQYYSELENAPGYIATLPIQNSDLVQGFFDEFVRVIEETSMFDPEKESNPKAKQIELESKLSKSIRNSYDWIRDFRIYLLEKEVSKTKLKEISKEIENAVTEARNKYKQIDDILKSSREASGAIGVGEHAVVFEKQAKKNFWSAMIWLFISAIGAGGIGYFLWSIFSILADVLDGGTSNTLTFQLFIVKILLFSFASVAFYQIVRNYTANMHLFTLNRHRENSLRTFKVFYDSTEDPRMKDAILLQATKAIFEAGETGYVRQKEGSTSVLEITKLLDRGAKE